MRGPRPSLDAEWLETDGLGGFASGTVGGERTRRYHALLVAATTPPTGRMVLLNGLDVWVQTASGTYPVSTQRWASGVAHPDGQRWLQAFAGDPWPSWTHGFADGTVIRQQLFMPRHKAAVVVTWTVVEGGRATLWVRPFLSGRDHHGLTRGADDRSLLPEVRGQALTWRLPRAPAVTILGSGHYEHRPEWYRGFLYAEERARGYDAVEDLASPGTLGFELSPHGSACLIAAAGDGAELPWLRDADAATLGAELGASERQRRGRLGGRLERAADAYVVRRGAGKTIVAGYPWFSDWGRDTFIAVRGLCLATRRIADAASILVEWASRIDAGMVPNRFVDDGSGIEFNSVDASLWYVVAAHELMDVARASARQLAPKDRRAVEQAILQIVAGYAAGTRHGIGADTDGLLRCGEPGTQLTWMDARVGDRAVTPRIGKPVEIQALWINALHAAARLDPRWQDACTRARQAFDREFWNEAAGCLFDVVDSDGVAGRTDPAIRPNQIFAVAGLPQPLLEGERAARVVAVVEERLWTPLGLRSLAPGSAGYIGSYMGDQRQRDLAYHQGTVWPWLTCTFVEAWLRTGRGDAATARRRFLAPLLAHLADAGLGHVSEIADGDPPHPPRGCPFQAWSVGEVLRLRRLLDSKTVDEHLCPELAS